MGRASCGSLRPREGGGAGPSHRARAHLPCHTTSGPRSVNDSAPLNLVPAPSPTSSPAVRTPGPPCGAGLSLFASARGEGAKLDMQNIGGGKTQRQNQSLTLGGYKESTRKQKGNWEYSNLFRCGPNWYARHEMVGFISLGWDGADRRPNHRTETCSTQTAATKAAEAFETGHAGTMPRRALRRRPKCPHNPPNLRGWWLAAQPPRHHIPRPPPCGNTWVCHVVIAPKRIAQAAACTEIKADHEPE